MRTHGQSGKSSLFHANCTLASLALLWVANGALAANQTGGTTANKAQPIVVPLKIMPPPVEVGQRIPLNASTSVQEGFIVFQNKSGKLRFRVEDRKVALDSNDDGKFDNADRPGASDLTPELRGYADKVVVINLPRAGGSPHKYFLGYTLSYCSEGAVINPFLNLISACCLTGSLASGENLCIVDANVNGRFDDQEDQVFLLPVRTKPKSVFQESPMEQIWLGSRPLLVGSMGAHGAIALGGRLFRPVLSESWEQLSLSPYEGVSSSVALQARVANVTGEFVLRNVKTQTTHVIRSGTASAILPGNYQIIQTKCKLTGAENGKPIYATLYGDGGVVTVKPGANALAFGPPFSVDGEVATYQNGKNKGFIVRKAFVCGAGGEHYYPGLTDASGVPRSGDGKPQTITSYDGDDPQRYEFLREQAHVIARVNGQERYAGNIWYRPFSLDGDKGFELIEEMRASFRSKNGEYPDENASLELVVRYQAKSLVSPVEKVWKYTPPKPVAPSAPGFAPTEIKPKGNSPFAVPEIKPKENPPVKQK